MTTKMTYYPGCSSEASGAHLDKSLQSIARTLGIELEPIEDWNCCGASVNHIKGGHAPTTAMSARNLAQAKAQGNQDVVTPCAACFLNTHYANEAMREDKQVYEEMNEALGAAGRSYDASLNVRHICEVLINDVGLDKIRESVKKPLKGLKVAGWVGCQTVRPHAATERGGNFDEYDNPRFLDDFIEAAGAEAVDFKARTNCCGGSVAVMSPDKTIHLMRDILQEAQERGVDCIATPCPLCQTNLEMYQGAINDKYGTHFDIPVVFYSQLLAVAFGGDPDGDAALNQNIIKAPKIAQVAK